MISADPVTTQGSSRPGVQNLNASERRPGSIEPDLAANDAPGDRVPGEDLQERQDKLVDEAIEETFPASDPIAPKRITK